MWILILSMLYYGDPASGRFSPAIAVMQFKNKSNCEAAKAAYLAEMRPVFDTLNSVMKDEKNVGEIKGPNGAILSVICVAQ